MRATRSTKSTNLADGTLKHYEVYIDKLENFANSIGVKIIRGHEPGEGSWSPSKNRIKLDEALSEVDEVSTLLHELGHCIDDKLFNDYSEDLHRAYTALYKRKFTKKQLLDVLATEKRAWKLGRKIASMLKIRLGKWYDTIAKLAIKNYI